MSIAPVRNTGAKRQRRRRDPDCLARYRLHSVSMSLRQPQFSALGAALRPGDHATTCQWRSLQWRQRGMWRQAPSKG
jgi:hypothetical protein